MARQQRATRRACVCQPVCRCARDSARVSGCARTTLRVPAGAARVRASRGAGAGRRSGLARPCSLGRASGPGGSSPRGSTPPTGLGCDFVTSSSPSSPFLSRRKRCSTAPILWTRRSRASRAGAAGDRSSGSPAAKAPRRLGVDARPGAGAPAEAFRGPVGRPSRFLQLGRSCPDAKLRLVGDRDEQGGAQGRALSGHRAPRGTEVPVPDRSPLPAAQPGDLTPPAAARGQPDRGRKTREAGKEGEKR